MAEKSKANDFLETVNGWYVEVLQQSDTIIKHPGLTLQMVRGYLDRWDQIKSDAFYRRVRAKRTLVARKAMYDDAMRSSLKGGVNNLNSGANAFEERKARYETTHIIELQAYRNAEFQFSELDMVVNFVREKERWLGQIRFELMEAEKRERYIATSEYNT